MAKKKIQIVVEANTEEQFHSILDKNMKTLICAEIYCDFAGHCTALQFLFHRMKLDWGHSDLIVLRVLADGIAALKRFHGHSEPVVMFILGKKVTAVVRGVNPIKITNVAMQEISLWRRIVETGYKCDRKTYELDEVTPSEEEWMKYLEAERSNEASTLMTKRIQRHASRKIHRAQILIPHLENLNFVLFWPHALHVHPELYELWGQNDIVMIAREEIVFTKEKAEDVLYQSNGVLNEASLHVLLSGKALAICFRLLATENHFVSLIRKIIYEDVLPIDENSTEKKQLIKYTAFDKYKSYSDSKEDILKQRREDKIKKKEEERRKLAAIRAEKQRLAREAALALKEAKKQEKEQLKLELLRAGKLDELEKLKEEVESDDDVDLEIPEEERPEEPLSESSDEEDKDEYFPPAGLLVPGFYSPPNDIAKCNGLALLFPKIVKDYIKPLPEFLPEHVLVMLAIQKRHDVIQVLKNHKHAVLHMGVFKASTPKDAVHLAFTVTQYDAMAPTLEMNEDDIKLCIMVSMEKDTTVLKLMDFYPLYVSRDLVMGEDDCARLFNVDYGDDYPNVLEDFQSDTDDEHIENQ